MTLEELYVKDIGGIRSAAVGISGRFTVITGESGSGKSSLIRALELIAGRRAQSSVVRGGEEIGEALALFTASKIPALPEELQPQDNSWTVRRTVSRGGGSKSYIQEKPVPLSLLAAAMAPCMAIQSQFAQLELLSADKQMDIVDGCGGQELLGLRDSLRRAFERAIEIERELVALKRWRKEAEERLQGMAPVIDMAKSLELYPSCEEEWERELSSLDERIGRCERLERVLNRFYGGKGGGGLVEEIESACLELCSFIDPSKGREPSRLADSAVDYLRRLLRLGQEEASKESISELEDERERLEAKLGRLKKCMRLAKVESADELIERCDEAEREMKMLVETRGKSSEMQGLLTEEKKRVKELAMSLRSMRISSAKRLEERVNAVLAELGMEGFKLVVQVNERDKVRSTGAEDVNFLLAVNDEMTGPVSKCASGGELSRLLLALEIALPDDQLPSVLVFDEVEAGLGGRAALLAGYKLKELSRRCQVILVTHEATIASMADQHIVVQKDRDESVIKEVHGDQRIREVARMLSGDYESEEALAHAEQLLRMVSSVGTDTVLWLGKN